jgi:fluoride exporter
MAGDCKELPLIFNHDFSHLAENNRPRFGQIFLACGLSARQIVPFDNKKSKEDECGIKSFEWLETMHTLRPVLRRLTLVVMGGALGTLCRYGMGLATAQFIGSGFPWGTLAVNLAGCVLIGIAYALAERTSLMGPSARLFFMTGFLGGLTTFSSFALETVNLARGDTMLLAGTNFLLNNAGGLLLVLVGIGLVRRFRP